LHEPAVELAKILVESGKGAFELCAVLSGGGHGPFVLLLSDKLCLGSEAMEALLKLARQVSTQFEVIDNGSIFAL
jgi:hypothetical protein